MDRLKVLVADDDFDIRELLRFLLESEGYEVVTAGNGFEALGAAMAEKPDLVVLDVVMPGENGYLVSRGIRQNTTMSDEEWAPRIPILLLTARDLSGDRDRERAFLEFSGADEVIYKPFEGTPVISRINELLAGRSPGATTGGFPPLRLTEVDLDQRFQRPAASLLQDTDAPWKPSDIWHL